MRFVLCLVSITAMAAGQTVTPAMLNSLQWRSVGPAATGGRIADIATAKPPGRPLEIFVATTSGGVFKSANEGVSWIPVFDRTGGMMSVGAIAVAPSNPAVVWAGGGEADNRQSSSWGDGVYKSLDGGTIWEKAGLEETRHVGKIVIHPTDPNTVYVAAVGHLWGSNPERGVFKTTDGGKSWNKVLYRDEHTGAIDLAMDPKDPNVLYAAMYQRQRKGWGFNGGGPGSGIFRTIDGGTTWTELTHGLPAGPKGRIGLSIFPGNPRVLYAIVEADPIGGGGGRAGRGAGAGLGGVFRSNDGGDTWEHLSPLNPRPCYYSRIYADPKDANRVYIMGSNRGLYISDDGGHNFRDVFSNVHGEDHVLWIDPENNNRLIVGGDGGVSISYDRGITWLFRLNLPIGQFYNISANNQDPFLICGGLQDNGSWCTPSASSISHGISFKDAFNIGGGDGMYAMFAGDDRTLLVSSQNGVTARLDLNSMQRQSIGPVAFPERPKPGEPEYRWYWTTPVAVSTHDPKTIYTGANVLFRSDDRGVSWRAISPDLTARMDREQLTMMGGPVPARAFSRHDGQANFSALTAIAESPIERDLLYAGADDGSLHMTRDGGRHWTDLAKNLRGVPPMLNVSGIIASRYAAGRVYLTVDGHFNDDYHAYVFVSEDYGRNWRSLADGLAATAVHRIREHPSNPDFLAIGAENGLFVSFDRGGHWTTVGNGLPPVPVYDLLFHERGNALVLGTHGRGIWILDHIEPLARLTPEVLTAKSHLFPIAPAHHEAIYNGQFWFGHGEFFAPNPPSGAAIAYFLAQPGASTEIAIADSSGETVRSFRASALAGLNVAHWDLRENSAAGTNGVGPKVMPGSYVVTVTPAGGTAMKSSALVLPDPRFPLSDTDRRQHFTTVRTAHSLQQHLAAARDTAQALNRQLAAMRDSVSTRGDAAKGALSALDKVSPELDQALNGIVRAIVSAGRIESAVDGYDGAPTLAQRRELEWASEDGASAVKSLNKLIEREMPAVYKAFGDASKWPAVKPVPAVTGSR